MDWKQLRKRVGVRLRKMLADDAHIVNCGAVSAAQFEAYIRRVERTDDDEPEYADSQVLVALAIELGKTIVILQPCGGYNHIDPTQWVPGAADKAVVIAAISEYDGPRASVGHYLAVNIAPHVNVGVGDLHMLRKEMWEREVGLPRYQAILDDPADRRDKTWIGGEIDRMRQELNNLRQQIVAAIQIVLVPKTLKAIPGLLSRDNDAHTLQRNVARLYIAAADQDVHRVYAADGFEAVSHSLQSQLGIVAAPGDLRQKAVAYLEAWQRSGAEIAGKMTTTSWGEYLHGLRNKTQMDAKALGAVAVFLNVRARRMPKKTGADDWQIDVHVFRASGTFDKVSPLAIVNDDVCHNHRLCVAVFQRWYVARTILGRQRCLPRHVLGRC